LLIIAGLFVGFGKSPYSNNFICIITNILFIGSALVAIEVSRTYLIKKGTSLVNNTTLVLSLISILFMFINLRPTQIITLSFNEPTAVTKFLGINIIPLLAMNLLASYFAYLGGALASIGYMGIPQGFEWFSPVLPNLNWASIALIGTTGPAIGFLIIKSNIQITQWHLFKGKKKTKKLKDPALSWIAVAVVIVLLIFFSFGFLGLRPTVIYSGSMQPSMDIGDIAMIQEVPIDKIRQGDVIQYRTENTKLIHRIQKVYEDGNTTIFITKGDANNVPDDSPILPEQVMGKVILNIPKIGWITIYFKSILNKIGFNL
jgi:signal peptidase